jgi:hypothetical protein
VDRGVREKTVLGYEVYYKSRRGKRGGREKYGVYEVYEDYGDMRIAMGNSMDMKGAKSGL